MTLEEKVGQMDQIVIGKLGDTNPPANGDCNNAGGNNDPLQTSCLQRVLIDYRTGSILSGGTDNPRTTPVTLGAEKEGRLPPPSRLKGPSSNGDSPTNREWDSPLRGQSLHRRNCVGEGRTAASGGDGSGARRGLARSRARRALGVAWPERRHRE